MSRRGRWSRREEGAVAIFLALVTCLVLIPLGGLAVDIGSQRVARRDVQAIADTVALDMSRQLTQAAASSYSAATLQSLADASRDRSGTWTGSTPTMRVYLGTIDASKFRSDQANFCGGSSDGSGYFTVATGSTVPTAVLVTATSSVNFAIMGGSGGVCRSAIAMLNSTACYKLGSWAADVNLGDSAMPAQLNDIFGLNLSLASYKNLAGASVTMAQLASTTQFGTPDALLTGKTSYGNLVAATIAALNAQGSPANAAAISTLGSFTSVGASTPTFALGNVIGVSPTDTAALNMNMNVLDVLTSSLLLADGTHAIYVPNLWANVAGTGNTIGSTLAVTEGAVLKCGHPNTEETHATTAQVAGSIAFNLINSSSLNLGSGNTVQTQAATGSLDVNVAKADGRLVSPPVVHCGTGTSTDPSTFSVNVATGAASVGLTTHVPVTGTVKVNYLSALGISLGQITVAVSFTVDIAQSVAAGAGTGVANVSIPPNDTTPVSVGSSPLALSGVTLTPSISTSNFSAKVTVGLLGIISVGTNLSVNSSSLTPILSAITSNLTNTADSSSFASKTLVPLAANIDSGILGPLSKGLGLRIGGADVYGIGATCNLPAIAG